MNIRIHGRSIAITHPDKIWFPESGYTKRDIVDYYHTIAPSMVPYMRTRPLTMTRYPDGITGKWFYHKDMPDYFPSWIHYSAIKKQTGDTVKYVVCDTTETLVYLASQACITPHIWLSTLGTLRHPDKLIFDLDPATEHDFAIVKKVAKRLYTILESLKITSYVMTTGSRGLHVVVPLPQKENFTVVREHAKTIAQMLVHEMPDTVTLASRKEKRGNKLLIDIMRNAFGQTAVAPYAVRARPHAPVATPLLWDELDNKKLRSDLYTIKTIVKRLEKVGNVWGTVFTR